jgi:uncharacterized membrane protein
VHPDVVNTIVTSNGTIKRCFMDEKQRTGALPRKVAMVFTIQPTGKVSKARVTTAEYQGSDFEACLSTAFRSLQFPGFSGPPFETGFQFNL